MVVRGSRHDFMVSNLSQQEMDLDTKDNNVIMDEDQIRLSNGGQANRNEERNTSNEIYTYEERKRRSSRKDIDYKYLNSFGFSKDGEEKKKKPR